VRLAAGALRERLPTRSKRVKSSCERESRPEWSLELSPRVSLEVGKTYKGGAGRNQKRHRRTAKLCAILDEDSSIYGCMHRMAPRWFFVSTALIRVSDRPGEDCNHLNPATMRIRHPWESGNDKNPATVGIRSKSGRRRLRAWPPTMGELELESSLRRTQKRGLARAQGVTLARGRKNWRRADCSAFIR